MRFVATSCLREGMRLAKPLYRNIDTMLTAGVILNDHYISSIQQRLILPCRPGAYTPQHDGHNCEIDKLFPTHTRFLPPMINRHAAPASII